jgi:hypothetical protein
MQCARIVLVLIIASAALGDERAEKRRLVSELLEVIDAKALIVAAFESHLGVMRAVFAESGGTAEVDPEFTRLKEQLFARIDYDRYYEEVYTPLFEERFTAGELQMLVKLFKTPHGQKFVQAMPQLGITSVEGIRIIEDAIKAAQEDIEKEDAAKYPWRKTMDDLLSLATALEARATDTNEYPAAGFEELEALLSPTYILEMPKVDAWGTPFLYVGNGVHYRFVSAGADRRFEWNARQLDAVSAEPVFSEDLDADIIFQDGRFAQAPKEAQEHRD